MSHGLKHIKAFHTHIEKIIEDHYGIKPKFSDVIGWGYNTTSIYVEDIQAAKYVIKYRSHTPQHEELLLKDAYFADYLKTELPTVSYIPNNAGELVTIKDGYLFALTEFISGMPPFDMSFDILEDVIPYFKKIHNTTPPKVALDYHSHGVRGSETTVPQNYRLLHGDITPSNILVSHGKLSAILDFEFSLLGPVEWDLASLVVFSWFRMQNESFAEILDFTVAAYGETIDKALVKQFAVDILNKRLSDILEHKESYSSEKSWFEDYSFTIDRLREIDK